MITKKNILNIEDYKPGKSIDSLEKGCGKKKPIKLASNENPLKVSKKVIKAIKDSLNKINRYPDNSAEILTEKLSQKFSVDTSSIIIGNGSDDIISMLCQAFLDSESKVIMSESSFSMYEICSLIQGAKIVKVPLKKDSYETNLNEIHAKISKDVRIIFLTNPNNPTGLAIEEKELENFLKTVPENIVVVIDEAYIEFSCAKSAVNYLKSFKNIVVLRTFSKVYGLAGLRVGYGFMASDIAKVLNKVKIPFSCNNLAQVGAIAILEDKEFFDETIKIIKEGKKFFISEFEKLNLKYIKTEANFFMIDIKRNADAFCDKMLQEGIAIRSMSAYNLPTSIRVTIGTKKENLSFIKTFKKIY